MKKIQILKENNLTFKDGCEKCKTTIFVVNNALLIRSTYTYIYVIWGRLYGFETQGKCEILQKEREFVRVFLAQFFF